MMVYLIFMLYAFGWCKADNIEPCDTHVQVINSQRSTGFRISSSSHAVACDRSWTRTWYRFMSGAGGEMPTSCPASFSCGTLGPVWLNGTNPTRAGENKTMTACLRFGSDCCAREWKVRVMKCVKDETEYYVYDLPRTPGCPMRYCAGKEVRCKSNEVSPNGFTPGCTTRYPKLKRDPVLSVGVNNETKRIRFKCEFDPQETAANIYHIVTWYQGLPEERIHQTNRIVNVGKTAAYLENNNTYGKNGGKPLFCLGHKISCKVRSYYSDAPEIKSSARKSNEFYAGFEINPKELELQEGKDRKHITVATTIPVACRGHCAVRLEYGQNGTDLSSGNCELNFTEGAAGRSKNIKVVSKSDWVNGGDKYIHLRFNVAEHANPVDWNCYKNISNVAVRVKDIPSGSCQTSGEPYVITFDKKTYHYPQVGDFVLARSTNRKFEVHVRTHSCNLTFPCNCAVAAREGDDVVAVDMCRPPYNPNVEFLSTVKPRLTTLERYKIGDIYVISFPSGASVEFKVSLRNEIAAATITVKVPSDDNNGTTGLCGNFDGNVINDILFRNGSVPETNYPLWNLTEHWKIPVGESLFYYKDDGSKKCLETRAKEYCICRKDGENKEVNCAQRRRRPRYHQDSQGFKRIIFPDPKNCGRRKRRDIVDANVIILPDDDDDEWRYIYDPVQTNVTVVEFPSKTGKTRASAKYHCTKALKESLAGRACFNIIVDYNISAFVEQCIFDVKATDVYEIGVASALDAMKSDCKEKTLTDLKYWKNDSTGSIAPPEEIGNSLCPNECSGRGTCQNATCICDSEYVSADCSLKRGQAPVLIGIPTHGLCDIRKRDCIRTRVIGMDFMESENLTCQMTEVIIGERTYVETTRKTDGVGQLLSFGEITCLLPYVPVEIDGNPSKSTGKPTGGFLITVSNDGEKFSKKKTLFLVYDSKCMNCSKDYKSCFWKRTTCKVNNYCFAPGDTNPNNWCQICDPKKNGSGFVKRTANKPPIIKPPVNSLMTFRLQKWRYVVSASDPEKQTLRYELVGDSHGITISSHGVLTWDPTKAGRYKFKVKAIDPCGLGATQNFVVEVEICACEGQNGGMCIWKNGQSICKCPDGCKGERCDEAVEGKLCEIKKSPGRSSSSSDGITMVIVAVVIGVVVLILAIFGVTVWIYRKKYRQSVYIKSNAQASVVYNSKVNAKASFGEVGKSGSLVNKGYAN